MKKKLFKRVYIEITNVCNLNCLFCSKTIREEMIKEAFIDSYQLLTSNVKFKMNDFMSLMRNSSNNTNTAKELETLNKQHKGLIAKKDKLLDFLIEDKITILNIVFFILIYTIIYECSSIYL